jgi:ABC-type branched-subunit amino acid transport system ATPase component
MSPAPRHEPGLDVDDLYVSYDTGSVRYSHNAGNAVVKGVTFSAPLARLTGLIGPNGAGKTTTFNACSGLLQPAAGAVHLFGRNVTRRGAAARAQMGLGRTYQRMELFRSLTVRENVAIGSEARVAGVRPWRQMLATPRERAATDAVTAEALALCGIEHLADHTAGHLSTGEQRLVELARAYAGQFRFLLLDEPSSGLDHAEAERFGDILVRLVAEQGLGILLVEHNMNLVMRICEYLYVLDFGVLIFEGTPSETKASPVVRAAYLGEEDGLAEAEQRAGVVT